VEPRGYLNLYMKGNSHPHTEDYATSTWRTTPPLHGQLPHLYIEGYSHLHKEDCPTPTWRATLIFTWKLILT